MTYDINYLKQNGVDVDSSIELLGDMETFNETLQDFLEETVERKMRLEKNKEQGNLVDYEIDVHAQKSDSKYLGFTKLAQMSYDHELKSKDNDLDYINNHYDELIEELDRIVDLVTCYLKG